MNKIKSFDKQYRFLSNFWPAEVEFEGINYPSVEHAYQAAKTLDLEEREAIRICGTAKEAKKLGKVLTLRSDWEDVKVGIMFDLCRKKFRNHPELKEKLLETKGAELEEGNWWGDKFWGICSKTGIGKNYLGRILMEVRNELKWPNYKGEV